MCLTWAGGAARHLRAACSSSMAGILPWNMHGDPGSCTWYKLSLLCTLLAAFIAQQTGVLLEAVAAG